MEDGGDAPNVGPALPLSGALAPEEIKVLLAHTRAHAWAFPLIIGLGVLSSFAEAFGVSLVILYFYTAMGRTHDAAAAGGLLGGVFGQVLRSFPHPGSLALLLLSIIMLKAAVSCAYAMLAGVMQHRLGEDVRNNIHRQFLEVEYGHIRRLEQSEMLNVLAVESWAVSNAYRALSRILINAAAVLVMLGWILIMSRSLTALALVGTLILVIATNLLARPARGLGKITADTAQEMAARMLHTLQGMRAIRAFAQEQTHQQAFEKASAEARFVAVRTEMMYAFLHPVSELGYVILLASMVVLASVLKISFPITLAAVAILYRLQGPLRELQANMISLAEMQAPLKSVARVLVRTDKRFPPQGHRPFTGLRSDITFCNVTFGYDGGNDRQALNGIDMTIPAGRTTAIVGASGAGKTTIVNLLLRLDEVCGGDILIDGVPMREIERAEWLSRIALAGQDVELMESDIRSNINVSKASASDEEIMEVAELAGIADLIRAQPYGLDHWIGSQGANLSGGQRQRLGLARALLSDPEILILDEATSALDPELEAVVRENIAERFAGRTLVIITHRLNTILNVDHIICVASGRVVQEGPPAQLIREKGSFRQSLHTIRR